MSTTPAVLEVRNIGKAYRNYGGEWRRVLSWFGLPLRPHEEHWTLQHISFSIQPGEAIGIVGQNGAGKSTLLKIITGTLKPSTGEVIVRGRIAAILELGMGFHPDLSGRQNAYHAAGLMGYSREQIDAVIDEIEAFAEVGEYFDQPVRTYSSGMQVRVAFAVATAWRPEVLIIDEALSVGDAYFQSKCYHRINNFKEKGTTLILVSHSMGDVVKHCERAILLKNGQIKIDSTSREVANLYMDQLFGKQKENKTLIKESSPLSTHRWVDGSEDLFTTRPGYHAQEHRWGHGGASIIDYLITSPEGDYPSRIKSNSNVEFCFKARFDEHFDNVIPGLLIKTLEGIYLYGTNSFISSRGKNQITVKPGETKSFCFSLPLKLNEGYYLVSFGISSGDPLQKLTPLDRRYDSVLIHIERAMQFWGIIDLDASFHCHDAMHTPKHHDSRTHI